ncbi:MAG: hypothetical protein Q8P47_01695 [Candidatus Beckwithbacteria bacterium]|nr:hypothetical protein [Candidatus Beckwithbacteria bacterium]
MNKGLDLMYNLLTSREKVLFLKAKLEDFVNNLVYKQLGMKTPYYDLGKLPKEIEIFATYDKKNDSYYAECPHLNDIYTAAATVEGLIENINDLVYEFFDVPRYIARNLPQRYSPSMDAFKALKNSKSKEPELNIRVRISPQLATA